MDPTATSRSRAQVRFVLVCQQVLMLAVLLAVTVPALAVRDLDLVPPRSASSGAEAPSPAVRPATGR